MRDKLLPCPFCGGDAKLTDVLGDYYVGCDNCLARTHIALGVRCTADHAIKTWNLRVPEPEPEPKPLTLEEVRERDGMPVWVVWTDGKCDGLWMIVEAEYKGAGNIDANASFDGYGDYWIAYDRPPKEVAR